MNLLQSQQRINELMSIFVAQVKGAVAIGHTDIARVSETVLLPIFAEVFGYKNLKNLNAEKINFPGIDLGDEVAKVGIQVTATPGSEKVKETLRQFVAHGLYDKYERLIIYILTEKQQSYSDSGYDEIIQGKIDFDPRRDILDYRDILREVSSFQIGRAVKVQSILDANFGQNTAPLFERAPERQEETVYLNLLEFSFPSTLYVADIAFDSEVPAGFYDTRKRKYRKLTERERAQKSLKRLDLKFAVDWECHESQLITFHDLTDDALPLSRIVDRGTVTPLSPEEYYGASEGYEDAFKSLLRRCLQQKLYARQVQWQQDEHFFIFCEVNGEPIRKESWRGKVEAERIVYERVMKANKPDEILHCKHFAFAMQFKHIAAQWFVIIQPDWFFSFDGYKRNFFAEDDLDWIKRHENNGIVFNHVRFLASFLRYDQLPLFPPRLPYRFLSFGELLSFDSAPFLNDREWNPPDEEQEETSEPGDHAPIQGALDL